MNSTAAVQARVTLPHDCVALVSELIEKLGGKFRVEEDGGEMAVVPPLPAEERPGRMLRGLRLREGLTQAQLAEAIGVPQSHISAYENNVRSIPRDKAVKLAERLRSVPENFRQGKSGKPLINVGKEGRN